MAPTGEKSILTRMVSLDTIYKTMLPPIVLAEGFNIRRGAISKFSKEVFQVGIVFPIFTLILVFLVLYGTTNISDSLPSIFKSLLLE
jgi:hypothetical protein